MMVEVLIKSYQNKWVNLGYKLTKTTLEKRGFGHNARSTNSRFSLVGYSLTCPFIGKLKEHLLMAPSQFSDSKIFDEKTFFEILSLNG
jgi:hypothetical protein